MTATLGGMGSFATALYNALLSAGVAAERAREVVDLFDRSVDERYGLHAQVLMTKADLAELRLATTSDLTELRSATKRDLADLRGEFTDLRGEFTDLRGEFADLRGEFTELRAEFAEHRMTTKSDFAELRAEFAEIRADFAEHRMTTKSDLSEFRSTVTRELSETNVRVARLETRIAETKSDLVKWMLAALTTQTALLLALKLV